MVGLRVTSESFAFDEMQDLCVVDSVCGKEVDLDRASAQADHEGWAYFFCSQRCRSLFTADPGRLAGTAPSQNSGEPR